MTPSATSAPLPVVCTLDATDLRERSQELLPGLFHKATGVEKLTNGARLRFSASSETLLAITRAIDTERRCCRFLRFALVVEHGEEPFSLEVTGPPGTAELLDELASLPGQGK